VADILCSKLSSHLHTLPHLPSVVPQDTMSKEITVYSTEHRSSLVGSIKLPNKTKSIPVPVYVVIVDDNSGSMGGARAKLCVEKTKTIITDCVKQGVDYRYAT
jgi:hypothetical protein